MKPMHLGLGSDLLDSVLCVFVCVCVRFLGGVELKGAVMEEVTVMMMTLSRNSRTALYSRAGR